MKTSSPFTGAVEFDKVDVTAPALPNSKNTKVSKATGVTVPVHIKNSGPTTRAYFADARLKKSVQVALPPPFACNQTPTVPGICIGNVLPPRATGAVFLAQAAVPIDMDAFWGFGDPDLWAKQVAPNTVAAQISAKELPYAFWGITPGTRGPYGPAGVTPTDQIGAAIYVQMAPFDENVTSIAGNFWADSVNNPATPSFDGSFTIDPGQTKTLDVHIGVDDAASIGTTVKGYLAIDAWNFNDPHAVGDELVTLPYEYTVKR